MSTRIILPFRDLGDAIEVGGQHHAPAALPPGKNAVSIVQEDGWGPGPDWMGAKNLPPPHWNPRSESLYRLIYRCPLTF